MIVDAWWVLDPVGHRIEDQKQQVEWLKEEEPGFEKVASGIDLPPDLWACDWCNADLVLVNEDGTKNAIPMYMSNALCMECVEKVVRQQPQAQDLKDQGLHPFIWWSNNGCPCPACKAWFANAVAEGHG